MEGTHMISRLSFTAGVFIGLLLTVHSPAVAQTTTYTDRTTWQNAVSTSTPIVTEDFNSQPLGGLTDNSANTVGSITVLPNNAPGSAIQDGAQPRQIDGTQFLHTLVDGSPVRAMDITFGADVYAIGFDFTELAAGDDLELTLGNGENFRLSTVLGGGHAGFVGFISTTPYDSILFHDPFISFCDAGIDNFCFAEVAKTVTYSDRTAWANDVDAFTPIMTEDFDSEPLGSLIDNASNTVGLITVFPNNAPGSAIQDGAQPRQIDGTQFLHTLVDGSPVRSMDVSFGTNVYAIGFDFTELAAGDDLELTLGTGENFRLSTIIGGAHAGFVGFISNTAYSSVTFHDPFISFCDAGIDNFCFVAPATELGAAFCFGDGSDGASCPCGNSTSIGAQPAGCEHTSLLSNLGGRIEADGNASFADDTDGTPSLRLKVISGYPNEFGMYVSGTSFSAFGPIGTNGFLCIQPDAELNRYFAAPAAPFALDANGDGDNISTGFSMAAADNANLPATTAAGVTIWYQFWFRDNPGAGGGACSAGSNLTSGVRIVWDI